MLIINDIIFLLIASIVLLLLSTVISYGITIKSRKYITDEIATAVLNKLIEKERIGYENRQKRIQDGLNLEMSERSENEKEESH